MTSSASAKNIDPRQKRKYSSKIDPRPRASVPAAAFTTAVREPALDQHECSPKKLCVGQESDGIAAILLHASTLVETRTRTTASMRENPAGWLDSYFRRFIILNEFRRKFRRL